MFFERADIFLLVICLICSLFGIYMVRIATIVMVIVLIFLIVLTSRLSTLPLIRAVERLRDRKKMPVTGAREFRQLAESYNTLYDAYRPKDTASGGKP